MENLYTPNHIRLYSGKYFNPLEPDPDMIDIEDIAHSLSMQCRFGGHTKVFYSVAEHSMNVCVAAPRKYELAALLHDASEAYLYDIPRPIKVQLTGYKEMEDRLMTVIAQKFGFEYPLAQEIKDLDEFELKWEWENLVIQHTDAYSPLPPNETKKEFLKIFNSLSKKR
jgi:5'-deoxynucleotidase YfbR-like HD superfamily hydrolase